MGFTQDQQNAIEAEGMSVAVSAAAGSGKTSVLINRIIRRVCSPGGDISRILAVTFTKAAAAEIVQRLMKALNEKLASDPSDKHVAAQALFANSARISTVHRFCLDVIHENFEQLSLPSDLSVGDETKLKFLAEKVMNKLIDDYFEGNVGDDEAIEDFAAFSDTFGTRKNPDSLVGVTLEIYDKLACKTKFVDALDENIQMYNNVDASNFLDSVWGIELLDHTRALCDHYRAILSDAVELERVNEIDRLSIKDGQVNLFEDDLKLIDEIMSGIDARDYHGIAAALDKRTKTNQRLLFKNKRDISPEMGFFRDRRSEFVDDVRNLKNDFYSYTDKEITFSFAETKKRLSELKTFLKAFDRRYREEKIRRRMISFSDMEHLALNILWDRENDAPSAAAMRVRDGFDEIFVDEYQDTNEVQDKIFSLISKEDDIFCVGDVKQSIYGFRGANSDIFNKILAGRKKYENGMTEKKTKIFLSMNFRSSNEIIDFCNAVFGRLLNVGEIKYGDDEKLHPGLKVSHEEPEIALLPPIKRGERSKEPECVAARVAALLASGRKPSEIAILLRSGKRAKSFEDALKNLNIPVRNMMDSGFFESEEVLLMLSLLNAIDNPARDVYLAATLKSPLFGFTLDDLLMIRRHGAGTLYDALILYTADTGFEKGKRFLAFLDKFRALVPGMPCDKLIWQIYLETGILSIVGRGDGSGDYAAEQAKANLIQLYNFSRRFGADSYRGLYDFVTFLGDVIEMKEKDRKKVGVEPFKTSGEAVSIMTIHGSKGLEFPVCIIAEAGTQPSEQETKLSAFYGQLGVAMKLAHPSGFGIIKSPAYMISLLRESKVSCDEALRVLYVAITRAKEKLIVTGCSGKVDFDPRGVCAMSAKYLTPYSLHRIKKIIDFIGVGCAGLGGYSVVTGDAPDPVRIVNADLAADDADLDNARRIVNDRLSFRYPFGALTAVPAKVAVSDLYPDLLDDGEGEAKEAKFDYCPRFLAGDDEQTTAAERGTATHTFMQFFDFDRVDKNGVRAEIDYLADKKFIFDSDKEKIDVRGIERFLRSGLAEKIRNSKDVWREKRFILQFDAADFTEREETKAALEGEKLLVQGVIDCAYRGDDGKIVVIDYKTDHFTRGTPRGEIEKTLRERHTRQLTYYKKACEMLFGEVGRVMIYSFALGDTVEIFGGEK